MAHPLNGPRRCRLAQQPAAITASFDGPARDLTRNVTWQEIHRGGMASGQQQNTVMYLLGQLGVHLSPKGEATVMAAVAVPLDGAVAALAAPPITEVPRRFARSGEGLPRAGEVTLGPLCAPPPLTSCPAGCALAWDALRCCPKPPLDESPCSSQACVVSLAQDSAFGFSLSFASSVWDTRCT